MSVSVRNMNSSHHTCKASPLPLKHFLSPLIFAMVSYLPKCVPEGSLVVYLACGAIDGIVSVLQMCSRLVT